VSLDATPTTAELVAAAALVTQLGVGLHLGGLTPELVLTLTGQPKQAEVKANDLRAWLAKVLAQARVDHAATCAALANTIACAHPAGQSEGSVPLDARAAKHGWSLGLKIKAAIEKWGAQ